MRDLSGRPSLRRVLARTELAGIPVPAGRDPVLAEQVVLTVLRCAGCRWWGRSRLPDVSGAAAVR
ncbi:hypothetical protein JCM4914_29210 [Streptomyces platensis subsp. malvinus]